MALIVYLVKSTKHATVKLQASAISSVTMESQLRYCKFSESFQQMLYNLFRSDLYFQEQMDGFFTVLALCHTVRVDRKDNNGTVSHSPTGFDYEYQASSPDEKAFVEACRR